MRSLRATLSAIAVLVLGVSVTAVGQTSGVLKHHDGTHLTAPAALTKHVLKGTYFDTSSPGASATCGTAGCSAFAPMYVESIPCPKPLGASCTYRITIESQNRAGTNDGTAGAEGVYQFFVDGAIPNPGPVGSACSCYTWSGGSRSFSLSVRGSSYAVTATVTNTVAASQTHSVAVNIGCNEVNGNASGCFAGSGFANLAIAVYAP